MNVIKFSYFCCEVSKLLITFISAHVVLKFNIHFVKYKFRFTGLDFICLIYLLVTFQTHFRLFVTTPLSGFKLLNRVQ